MRGEGFGCWVAGARMSWGAGWCSMTFPRFIIWRCSSNVLCVGYGAGRVGVWIAELLGVDAVLEAADGVRDREAAPFAAASASTRRGPRVRPVSTMGNSDGCCCFTWFAILLRCPYALPQPIAGHLWGRSPRCDRTWRSRSAFERNVRVLRSQLGYGQRWGFLGLNPEAVCLKSSLAASSLPSLLASTLVLVERVEQREMVRGAGVELTVTHPDAVRAGVGDNSNAGELNPLDIRGEPYGVAMSSRQNELGPALKLASRFGLVAAEWEALAGAEASLAACAARSEEA